MAVPEQTPYREHTGNGVTKSFALGFICESKDHLIVLMDELEPPIATWSLSGGNVVFTTAPVAGQKITLQRNTPFGRTTDYQSFNNSFRPQSVNGDFDRLWLKLQELGVADWLMKLYVDRLHQQQEQEINDLKDYVDDRDDELRAYLMEEIRKQGVALDQLDEYYNYLMERLAQIAVDKGWDASFVIYNGIPQKKINDGLDSIAEMLAIQNPFNGMRVFVKSYHLGLNIGGGTFVYDSTKSTLNDGGLVLNGWVRVRETGEVRVSWFGAKGDGVTDNSAAINKASAACGIDDLFVIDSECVIGSTITLPDCDINCEGSIVLKDAKFYTAVRFPNSETMTVDLTKLSGFSKGNTFIQIEDGYLDDINLKDYFMLITSPEVSVYRIDQAHYTDYGKIETHDIISNTVTRFGVRVFTLSDPILFDFDDFSRSTVTLVKKKAHKTVKNLKITQSVADGPVEADDRTLLSLDKVSNKSFDNLLIDAVSDKTTQKLRITDSCNIIFNSPRITKRKAAAASSYTIVLYNTAYITFNDYVSYAFDNDAASLSGRHANHVYFNGCTLQSVGDHFGYNYYFDKCTLHEGIVTSGINVTATNCTFINEMFSARNDAPNYGKLSITNCDVYQTSLGPYRALLKTTPNIPNPRGVPVVESFFDDIFIDNINVYTTDDSRSYAWLLMLRGITSDSYLASNEDLLEFRTLNSFIFKNVKVIASKNSTVQTAYLTMRFPCKYTLIENVTVTKADGSEGRVSMYNASAEIDPYTAWDAETLLKSKRMELKNITFSTLRLAGVAKEITIEDCVVDDAVLNNGYKNRAGTTVAFKSSLVSVAVDAPAAVNGSRISIELFDSTIDLSAVTTQESADYRYMYYDINRIEGTYLTATSNYIPAALVGKLPSYFNPAKYKASLPAPITP
ncbi:hypothetical protein [Acinetobacter sp. F-1]|uniref:hypothetical protein n=1 Tax=Acinetobacter sp. F-1 TaxID=1796981 RepID=UPI001FD107B9|nr:hypothetical protein [Acinetobacter sp. F-1]